MKTLINDTISITPQHHESWLRWMRTIVMPMIKNEPALESFRLTRIKGGGDENGITYACQFICPNAQAYSDFIDNFDPKLQREQENRFSGNFGSFRSILEVLDEC